MKGCFYFIKIIIKKQLLENPYAHLTMDLLFLRKTSEGRTDPASTE